MAAWFHLHWLQIKMTSQTIKLPVPFDTIEVEFQMASGDIIWWPACVTSIHTDISGQNSLAAAELTYDAGSDNNNHFYEVEHGSVIIISQTSLRATSKSNTFNKNALLRWRFQVLRISWFTQLSWGYKVQTDCSEGTKSRRNKLQLFLRNSWFNVDRYEVSAGEKNPRSWETRIFPFYTHSGERSKTID